MILIIRYIVFEEEGNGNANPIWSWDYRVGSWLKWGICRSSQNICARCSLKLIISVAVNFAVFLFIRVRPHGLRHSRWIAIPTNETFQLIVSIQSKFHLVTYNIFTHLIKPSHYHVMNWRRRWDAWKMGEDRTGKLSSFVFVVPNGFSICVLTWAFAATISFVFFVG